MNYWSSLVFVWFLLVYPVYPSSGNMTGINAQISGVLNEVLLSTVSCNLVYIFEMHATLVVVIVNY